MKINEQKNVGEYFSNRSVSVHLKSVYKFQLVAISCNLDPIEGHGRGKKIIENHIKNG